MAELLVDTDVVIDHLRGAARLTRPPGKGICCSVITRAELIAGPVEQDVAVRRLLATFRELPVSGAIAEVAGGIKRATGIALPDALIAATALTADLELWTRNRLDFERVEGLRVAR